MSNFYQSNNKFSVQSGGGSSGNNFSQSIKNGGMAFQSGGNIINYSGSGQSNTNVNSFQSSISESSSSGPNYR